MAELTFLGTGTSNGIPMIGCRCDVCTSRNPRDRRMRSSVVIRHGGVQFLVDTATELRVQALAVGLSHVDAVLMTHAHADHTGGFDDLRRFNELAGRHLPCYAGPETAGMLRERYAYAFVDAFAFYGGKPDIILHEVTGPFEAQGVTVVPIPVMHGRTKVNGYRFDRLAYLTDAKDVPASSVDLMRGVDVLVVNALRERPHPTHLNVEEALAVIAEVKPRVAYLTHVSHEMGHHEGSRLLPDHVHLAYDGLTVWTDDNAS